MSIAVDTRSNSGFRRDKYRPAVESHSLYSLPHVHEFTHQRCSEQREEKANVIANPHIGPPREMFLGICRVRARGRLMVEGKMATNMFEFILLCYDSSAPCCTGTKKEYFCFALGLSPLYFLGIWVFLVCCCFGFLLGMFTLVSDCRSFRKNPTVLGELEAVYGCVFGGIEFFAKCIRMYEFPFMMRRICLLRSTSNGCDYGINPRRWSRRSAAQR